MKLFTTNKMINLTHKCKHTIGQIKLFVIKYILVKIILYYKDGASMSYSFCTLKALNFFFFFLFLFITKCGTF